MKLNENEVRVLGSLVEKQLTTPEYYPLTLNALVAACNQKSNRDPVMSLDEAAVQAAVATLQERNLVYLFYGSTSRTVKYKHMLPNVLELDAEAVAVMTLLMLRGPQTAGEIRGRADRLHEFSSVAEVQATLEALAARSEPLVARLERMAGQKEARYAHLLSGEIDQAALAAAAPRPAAAAAANERVERLEQEVERLTAEIAELRETFEGFRKQFE